MLWGAPPIHKAMIEHGGDRAAGVISSENLVYLPIGGCQSFSSCRSFNSSAFSSLLSHRAKLLLTPFLPHFMQCALPLIPHLWSHELSSAIAAWLLLAIQPQSNIAKKATFLVPLGFSIFYAISAVELLPSLNADFSSVSSLMSSFNSSPYVFSTFSLSYIAR